MKPILVRPAAAADIEDAFEWYQTQRFGLGEEFRDVLRSTLNQIAENPQLYQVIHRGTRRALLKRFPLRRLFPRVSSGNNRRRMHAQSSQSATLAVENMRANCAFEATRIKPRALQRGRWTSCNV